MAEHTEGERGMLARFALSTPMSSAGKSVLKQRLIPIWNVSIQGDELVALDRSPASERVLVVELSAPDGDFTVPAIAARVQNRIILVGATHYDVPDTIAGLLPDAATTIRRIAFRKRDKKDAEKIFTRIIDRRRAKREARHLAKFKKLLSVGDLSRLFERDDVRNSLNEVLVTHGMVAVIDEIEGVETSASEYANVDLAADGRTPRSTHPGRIVDYYVKNSRVFSEDYFRKNIENLSSLTAGEIRFDESFRDEFRKYIGDQADALFAMQEMYDWEQRNNRTFVGHWEAKLPVLSP